MTHKELIQAMIVSAGNDLSAAIMRGNTQAAEQASAALAQLWAQL